MPLAPGQSFGRYTVEGVLGAGGMGEVYQAFDTTLHRRVALKVIHPDLDVPDAAARLVREARAAAALTHPNTIAIHDLGELDGVVYLVMELVAGAPLRAYVGDPAVPITTKIRWLVDVARGLAAAHRAGLVHRDVKPTNVMVADDGRVKVLDFGLAKPVEGASARTDVGLVVGTPRYMAPELFRGLPADARSDEYAFGVTAYELLSGMYPGGPTGAVPAALDSVAPEVGAAVARVVGRTLARDREDRFPSMDDVATELEAALREVSPADADARVVSPPTRPDGAVVRRVADDLALAPTELSPAEERRPGLLAEVVAPEPKRRGPSVAGVLAVLGLLSFAGVYAATRFVDDADGALVEGAAIAADDASATSSDPDDGGLSSATGDDDDGGPASEDEVDDAGSDLDASDLDDAGVEEDDAGDAPSRFLDDEFPDPWLRPKR